MSEPFIRFAWKSVSIQKEWNRWQLRMSRLSHEVEYQSVVVGLRDVNVYHLNSGSYDIEIEKVFLDNLVFLPIRRVKSYAGFAHRHYPTKKLDMNTMVFGVVAKDLKTAERFRAAHYNKTNHQKIGEMLGYPSCCIKFFCDTFPKNIFDPVFESASQTAQSAKVEVTGSAFTNILLRYIGLKILPFFPCRFDCEEAIKFGERFFNLMKQIDSEASQKLKDILEMPCNWSLRNQVIMVDHELFYLIANGYYCKDKKEVIWNGLEV